MTCVHKWQIDRQNVGTCSLCGEVRQFPLEKGQDPAVLKKGRPGNKRTREKAPTAALRTKAKAKYYADNRGAIVEDLLNTGRAATANKWGICKGMTYRLIERWLTPEQRASMPHAPSLTPVATTAGPESGNGRLPHFPEFSATWDPSVQLKWLEVYENLHNQGGQQ
jgi:hypothetical protein